MIQRILQITSIPTLLISIVLLTGCGGDEKGNGKANGGGNNGAAAGNGARGPSFIEVDGKVKKTLDYADLLLRDGRYEKAKTRLNAVLEDANESEKSEINERLQAIDELAGMEEKAAEHVANLDGGDGSGKLDKLGEEGKLVLRKLLRDIDDPAQRIAIVKYLKSKNDYESVYTLFDLWKENSDAELSSALIDAIAHLIDRNSESRIPTSFLVDMMLYAQVEDNVGRTMKLKDAAGKWEFHRIDKMTMDGWLTELSADKKFKKVHIAEILMLVYQKGAGGNKTRFAGFFTADPMTTIGKYIRRYVNSSSKKWREWAEFASPKFGMINFAALKEQLALHYTFDEDTDSTYVRDSLNRKRGSKLLGDLINSLVPDGGIADGAIRFKGTSSLTLPRYEAINNLMLEGYSYSMWIKPSLLPGQTNAGDYALLAGRHKKNVGLRLLADGRVSMLHPLQGGRVNAVSTASIPAKQWSHVVGVVSPLDGYVRVFINGQRAGEATLKGEVANAFDGDLRGVLGAPENVRVPRPRRVRGEIVEEAKPPQNTHAYVGLMDELRIYHRALSDEDVRDIHKLDAE